MIVVRPLSLSLYLFLSMFACVLARMRKHVSTVIALTIAQPQPLDVLHCSQSRA